MLFSYCSFGTWSIIIVDPVTRQIGIAAASCSYSVYGIGGIVPGKGAIVAQAMSNMRAKKKGMEMLAARVEPKNTEFRIQNTEFRIQITVVQAKFYSPPQTPTGREF